MNRFLAFTDGLAYGVAWLCVLLLVIGVVGAVYRWFVEPPHQFDGRLVIRQLGCQWLVVVPVLVLAVAWISSGGA